MPAQYDRAVAASLMIFQDGQAFKDMEGLRAPHVLDNLIYRREIPVRPNDFRKVLSIVGSFVNLGDRGGDTYADIVRKSEKKPLRVFLQDGRNDNRGQGRGGGYDQRRDWFLNNVRLKDALTAARPSSLPQRSRRPRRHTISS